MEQQIGFDFNEVLEQLKSGKNLTGKDGLWENHKIEEYLK